MDWVPLAYSQQVLIGKLQRVQETIRVKFCAKDVSYFPSLLVWREILAQFPAYTDGVTRVYLNLKPSCDDTLGLIPIRTNNDKGNDVDWLTDACPSWRAARGQIGGCPAILLSQISVGPGNEPNLPTIKSSEQCLVIKKYHNLIRDDFNHWLQVHENFITCLPLMMMVMFTLSFWHK